MSDEPTTDQPVSRAVVFDGALPPKTVSRVEVRRIRMLPNYPAGLHVHNCPVFGNIVEGSVIYQIEGGAPQTLRAGDIFYEPQGARIARFDALEEGVTFLGYFLVGDGELAELHVPER
jgi:quercetin dioxygenase-like cupin family protein